MMKVWVLQTLYNLSDEQMEYQIKDRLSFMRFLGLGLHERIPDAKTIWLYRERLKGKKVMNKLFKSFDDQLKAKGYIAMEGQIVDASIVQAPRQRMSKEEKEEIKQGKMPEATKRANNKRSKIRAKVEHLFAHMKHHGKLFIRTIGLERAKVKIGLANLVYNMKRLIYWEIRTLQRG